MMIVAYELNMSMDEVRAMSPDDFSHWLAFVQIMNRGKIREDTSGKKRKRR